jgi:hypothetical protein
MPWSESMQAELALDAASDGADRHLLRKMPFRSLIAGAVTGLIVVFCYMVYAAANGFPWWTYLIAAVAGAAIEMALFRIYRILRAHPAYSNSAVPQSASLFVRGELEDVRQFSVAALGAIGARTGIVDPMDIHASAGIRLNSRVFLGEYVHVRFLTNDDAHTVTVESIKLDWATPSRTKRHIGNFLDEWAFYPSFSGNS